MDRIGPAGGSPTVALSNGQQGFVDENLSSGQEGTNVPAEYMNGVQEELMSILAAADTTPNIANFGQVLGSLLALCGGTGSLGNSGNMTIGGGLIVQWGQATASTGNGDIIAFPEAFPNACFGVVVMERNANWGAGGNPSPSIYGVNTTTAANFKVYAGDMVGGVWNYLAPANFFFIALGH